MASRETHFWDADFRYVVVSSLCVHKLLTTVLDVHAALRGYPTAMERAAKSALSSTRLEATGPFKYDIFSTEPGRSGCVERVACAQSAHHKIKENCSSKVSSFSSHLLALRFLFPPTFWMMPHAADLQCLQFCRWRHGCVEKLMWFTFGILSTQPWRQGCVEKLFIQLIN